MDYSSSWNLLSKAEAHHFTTVSHETKIWREKRGGHGGNGGKKEKEAIQRIGRGGTLIGVSENEGVCKLQSLADSPRCSLDKLL